MTDRAGRRLAVTALLAFALAAAPAVPAAAHNTLRLTDPADRATLERTPAAVVLTFDEPAVAMGTEVVVTGPAGPVEEGPPRLAGNTVIQPVRPGSPAGAYAVDWRVTSADGHPITGRFTFSTAAAGDGTPGPADARAVPGPTVGSGAGLVWLTLPAAALVAAGAAGILRRRRGRRPR